MEIVFVILGLLIGAALGVMYERGKIGAVKAELQVAHSEVENLKKEMLQEKENAAARALEQVENERKHAQEMLQMAEDNLNKERQHQQILRQESDKQWQEKLNALKNEMLALSSEQLKQRQMSLEEGNYKQLGELLKPVKEQFLSLREKIEESRTANEVGKRELKDKFENVLNLFQQEQKNTVMALKAETERIGNDAANLTKALKGESKTQGDWGEMILETALQACGLKRDLEYFVQENVKDEEGKNFRPDVVVKFPDGKAVVIDSKVSLTAYVEAVNADNDLDRQHLIKEHVRSVRHHVDELAAKNYSDMVLGSMPYVLMFIPNDSSYFAAIKEDANLYHYAFQKHIIIISSGNLMVTLKLIQIIWQNDRQNKNVEKIVKQAAEMYDKLAGFETTFGGMEKAIKGLREAYDKAYSMLYIGRGNLMRRMESVKDLGVEPKKQLQAFKDD